MQIERKAEDCYKAEYARRHLGECYEGTISGVTQRGLFVELDNGVEGFVPASSLTPSGTSLTEGVRLTDPASGKTWSLGDKMMITIVRADVNLGKIDFEVAPAAKPEEGEHEHPSCTPADVDTLADIEAASYPSAEGASRQASPGVWLSTRTVSGCWTRVAR